MKKLVLVTLLAVAASWLLSEAQPTGPSPEPVPTTKSALDHGGPKVLVEQRTEEPGAIRKISSRKGDGPRSRRTSQAPPAALIKSATSDKTPPSWFPKSELEEQEKAGIDAFGSRVLLGRVSASEDRARQDLRKVVEREVAKWIAADVPTSWKVPPSVIDRMSQGSYVQEVTRSLTPTALEAETPSTEELPGVDGLYILHRAGQKLDFSPTRRAQIVQLYRRDLASHRMQRLGGGLALALVGLAVLSGYIKADEATKGYYTNRLRLLAAAGLGASGVVAYRFLA